MTTSAAEHDADRSGAAWRAGTVASGLREEHVADVPPRTADLGEENRLAAGLATGHRDGAAGRLTARGVLALQRRAGNSAAADAVERSRARAADTGGRPPARPGAQAGTQPPTRRPTAPAGGSAPARGTSAAAPTTGRPSGPAGSRPGPSPARGSGAGAVGTAGAGGASGARTPAADPRFTALSQEIAESGRRLAAHPSGAAAAGAAQAAAVEPAGAATARGRVAQAGEMAAAPPGEFDKAAFVAAVDEAIEAQAPRNLEEADEYAESGRADAVHGAVSGQVREGTRASAAPLAEATTAAPDSAASPDRPATPLAPDRPPPPPRAPDPSGAVPRPVSEAALDMSAGPRAVDEQLAEADVTDDQLARSNEPELTGALAAKREGESHARQGPATIRATETEALATSRAQAGETSTAALADLAATRRAAGQQLAAGQGETRSEDERRRAEVAAELQAVFDATRSDVEGILGGLDEKVDARFTRQEQAARKAFTAEHRRRMDAYKDRRYSGLAGAGRWLRDKVAGLPEEADQIFDVARQGYVRRMRDVISGIADLIGAELGRAKARIQQGRARLDATLRRLPADLRAYGRQRAQSFSGQFDELTETVSAKSSELVDTLATRYTEAVGQVDEAIEAERARNRGLVERAMAAVGGAVRTILELKGLLLGVLAKAATAVQAIIQDPIGFLGNLASAVSAGLRAFVENIGRHLRQGLVGWLTGAMASTGLQLPARFDLRGILGMVAQLMGLTWASLRQRVIRRARIPERVMTVVEGGVALVQRLSGGVAGIVEAIAEKVADLRENLFSKISEYLIPTIITAGITWLMSLLNPASAFVRAVKAIVDFVSFIVNQGAQIAAFVNSVLDAIIAIAGGGRGGVPALIERALASSVPVLIGALASLLGIGGIAEKVKQFFRAMARPVWRAVDWVVGKVVTLAKKAWRRLKQRGHQGVASDQSPTGALDRANRAVDHSERLLRKPGATSQSVNQGLAEIRNRYGLREAHLHEGDGQAHVTIQATRRRTPSVVLSGMITPEMAQKIVERVFTEILSSQELHEQVARIVSDREAGLGRSREAPRKPQSPTAEGLALLTHPRSRGESEYILQIPDVVTHEQQTRSHRAGHIFVTGLGEGGTYSGDIAPELERIRITLGLSHFELSLEIQRAERNQRLSRRLRNNPSALSLIARYARLQAIERGRVPGHIVMSPVSHELVAGGATILERVTKHNLASLQGAGSRSRRASRMGGSEGLPMATGTALPGHAASLSTVSAAKEYLRMQAESLKSFALQEIMRISRGDFSEREAIRYLKDRLHPRLMSLARSASIRVTS